MKSKKTPAEQPVSPEEKAIEERVAQMLDPSLPDPKPQKAPFEVIKEAEPISAPEVATGAVKIPIKIALQDEDPTVAAVPEATTPAPKTAPEIPAKPVTPKVEEPKTEEPAEPITLDEPVTEETTPEEVKTPEQPEPPETHDEPIPAQDEAAIDKAVDDIQTSESDELLKKQDEEVALAFDGEDPGFFAKIGGFFAAWWNNKLARYFTIFFLLAALAAAAFLPASRYYILNLVGVRSSASITVLDESTQQPLRNVTVKILDQSALTDENGYAQLEHLKLGQTDLTVEKRAFAPTTQKITIGWGSNPLSETRITPVGAQYSFVVTDFLSGKPIEKAEAVYGEYSAFSDEAGRIKLTIDDSETETFAVAVIADTYRQEQIELDADTKEEMTIKMAPARKHVFISKRSGTYDVYKIDADGKNEEVVLKGTGNERDDIVLVPHPTQEIIALVSTRNNERNDDGFLLSTLTLIDLADNSVNEVAESERIQIVDWVGDRLVYVRIAAGASAAKPDRHRLIGYDYNTGAYTEIARSNYFNDVMVAKGKVFYAPSSAYQASSVALYKSDADGGNRETILEEETWNLLRTTHDSITLTVGQDWYEYHISDNKTSELDGEPANLRSRVYADSPDGKHSLWVDQRDGKGVLVSYNTTDNEDKVLHTQSGLKTPVRWLNNSTIAFRISTDTETADYVMSLDGGEPVKIRDVTNTSGIDRWYYY